MTWGFVIMGAWCCLTPELSDAGGPARPHCQLTLPARVRSSDFVRALQAHVLERAPVEDVRVISSRIIKIAAECSFHGVMIPCLPETLVDYADRLPEYGPPNPFTERNDSVPVCLREWPRGARAHEVIKEHVEDRRSPIINGPGGGKNPGAATGHEAHIKATVTIRWRIWIKQ